MNEPEDNAWEQVARDLNKVSRSVVFDNSLYGSNGTGGIYRLNSTSDDWEKVASEKNYKNDTRS